MRVLVTGGTGYLGSAIVRALARRGHTPVVFARRRITAVDPAVQLSPATSGHARPWTPPSRLAMRSATPQRWSASGAAPGRLRRRERRRGRVTCSTRAAGIGVARLVYTSSFLALPPAGRPSAARSANDYQRTKVAALAARPLGRRHERRRRRHDHSGRRLRSGTARPRATSWRGCCAITCAAGCPASSERIAAGRSPGWTTSPTRTSSAVDGGHLAREYPLGGEVAPQRRIFELARESPAARCPAAARSGGQGCRPGRRDQGARDGSAPLITPAPLRFSAGLAAGQPGRGRGPRVQDDEPRRRHPPRSR